MIRDPKPVRNMEDPWRSMRILHWFPGLRHFSQGFLRLTSSTGRLLEPERSLEEEGVKDGDVVTAVVQIPRSPGQWVDGVEA